MQLRSFLLIYITLIITLIIINACTIKKRVYRSGYNVEWNGSHKNPAKKDLTNNNIPYQTSDEEITNPLTGPVTASAENAIEQTKTPAFFLSEKQTKRKNTASNYIDPCDTIIFKNGLKIKAKILEISSSEIKYKMCDNQDGPLFIKKTNDVATVNHANGSVTELGSSTTTITITNSSPNTPRNTSSGTSGKSQLVALLLCGFLGFLGIHRFYLGQFGIGILMLFTCGCGGILWIIDFIRIITGDLQPEEGDYSEKL